MAHSAPCRPLSWERLQKHGHSPLLISNRTTACPLYIYSFPASEASLTLHFASVILKSSCLLVSITPTDSTIPQLCRWCVVLYARFLCTLDLFNADASKTSGHQNCSRSSTTWSSRWNLEYTAHFFPFHPKRLSKAVWKPLCSVSALLSFLKCHFTALVFNYRVNQIGVQSRNACHWLFLKECSWTIDKICHERKDHF